MKQLHCPRGHTGPFRYVEKIEAFRYVRGFNLQGELEVWSHYQSGSGYDDKFDDPPMLECHHCDVHAYWNVNHMNYRDVGTDAEIRFEAESRSFCGVRFLIPQGLEIDWL